MQSAFSQSKADAALSVTTARTHILLVEDNDDYAELIQQTFARSGAAQFQVRREQRLDDALGVLEREHYDAMLLDLSLPDGYGAFTVGSACALARHLPILVLTGTEDSRLADAAISSGAIEYLVKQRIDRRELPAKILRAIDRHSSINGLSEEQPSEEVKFTQEVAGALARCNETAGSVAVVFLRYDNFETLSCLFGKRICDEMDRCASILLSEPALVVERIVPIRPGTFAAVLEDVRSEESVARVAAHLLRTLSEVEMTDDKGFKIDGITASIGVSVAPWDGATPDELIENASAAQRKAAREGGSRYEFFRPQDYL